MGPIPRPLFLLLASSLLADLFPFPQARHFQFPTANRALLEPGAEADFFVPTPGRDWTSGSFGCVRTEGWQMHEGIDIKHLERNRSGEPIDPIFAAADGTVAYINRRPGLSNYGNYILLRHEIEGLEIITNYAHISEIRPGLETGDSVRAGEIIGTMGRTTNTRTRISQERAHLHFEIALLLNPRFPEWHAQTFSGSRNDHGVWNGQNLAGLDPGLILRGQADDPRFSLLEFIRNQTELCRVLVRSTDFSWLQRYTPLVRRNPAAEREGVAGYEIALNFNGLPFLLIPRAPSEITNPAPIHLLSVNEEEQRRNPCRRLVAKKGGQWEIAPNGLRRLQLITF